MDIKEKVLRTILEDEKEYCFDKGYNSDINWNELNKGATRSEVYNRIKSYWLNIYDNMTDDEFFKEIEKQYDDKYNYILYLNKN